MKIIIPLLTVCLFTFQLFAQDINHLTDPLDSALDKVLHYIRGGLVVVGLLLLILGIYLAFFRGIHNNGLLSFVIGLCMLLGGAIMYFSDNGKPRQQEVPEVFLMGTQH